MATTVVSTAPTRDTRARSIRHLFIGWLLVLPLVFFGVGGIFSFEGEGEPRWTGGSSMAGLAQNGHHIGFLGYVVIPGIAYSIVLWQIAMNAKRIASQAMQMKMISLFALLTISSAIWSQDPFRSAYNGIFYCVETLFAFYLILKFDTEEILSLFMMVGSSLCVLSLITIFFFPHYGLTYTARDMGAWHGVSNDRTAAAKCMVFLVSPAIIFRRRLFKYRHMVYIALLLLMMFKARSATGRVVTCVYIALMVLISVLSRFGRRSSLIIGGASLTAAASITYFGLAYLPL
jgi:hypothetical protein